MYPIFPFTLAHPGIALFFQLLTPLRPVLVPATLQFAPDVDPQDDPSHTA